MTDDTDHLEVWNLLSLDELAMILVAGGADQIPRFLQDRARRLYTARVFIRVHGAERCAVVSNVEDSMLAEIRRESMPVRRHRIAS